MVMGNLRNRNFVREPCKIKRQKLYRRFLKIIAQKIHLAQSDVWFHKMTICDNYGSNAQMRQTFYRNRGGVWELMIKERPFVAT